MKKMVLEKHNPHILNSSVNHMNHLKREWKKKIFIEHYRISRRCKVYKRCQLGFKDSQAIWLSNLILEGI